MPNMCENKLTITGPSNKLIAFKEKAVGPDPILQACKEQAEEPKVRVLEFLNFISIPDDVLSSGDLRICGKWVVDNWGRKFGAYDPVLKQEEIDEGNLVYLFQTAYTPPGTFLGYVSEQFPELVFRCEYYEPQCGFSGVLVFKNGETLLYKFDQHEF